jgi:glycosyltransferase involved in cell wall biosynthesis
MKVPLLIIANCSTHHTAPRGIQGNRLINELAKYYDVHLITSTRSIPDQKEYFSNKPVQIVTVPDTNPYILKGLSEIFKGLNTRDIFWTQKAKSIAREIIYQNDIKYIVCLALKYSNIDLGVYLKKNIKKIQLISFFSDPIIYNPYRKYGWFKTYYNNYEKKLLKHSDKIVYPSLRMAEKYQMFFSQYKEKIFCIPHSFEKNINQETDIPKNDVKYVRYIGSLNDERSPVPLLKHLIDNKSFYEEKGYRFEFIGNLSKSLQKQIIKLDLPDYVKFKKNIPYKEVDLHIKKSFALLVVDANFKESLFLPSKLVEQLPYNKPLIGITPKNSETERVLTMIGHFSMQHDGLNSLPDVLLKIETRKEPNISTIEDFSISNIGRLWRNLIQGS